jgi:tetratricopeptide (TPR) repeat protein
MGRERIGPRKHVCFYFAVLMLLASCTGLNNWMELRNSMRQGQALLAQGDYDGSVEEYQRALRFADQHSPADLALFNLGLIYIDPQNPKKDDQKAAASFAEIVSTYPQSPQAPQAKIWLAVLNERENSKAEIQKSKQAIDEARQEIEQFKQLLELSRQELERSRQEVEKSKQFVERSKQAIEKSNQVDIQIEQKKRERGR